jgi:hypothetical protein
MNDDKKPLRVDEREAEPRPPEEERLDERVEEVPPTPPTPPESEPEDDAA